MESPLLYTRPRVFWNFWINPLTNKFILPRRHILLKRDQSKYVQQGNPHFSWDNTFNWKIISCKKSIFNFYFVFPFTIFIHFLYCLYFASALSPPPKGNHEIFINFSHCSDFALFSGHFFAFKKDHGSFQDFLPLILKGMPSKN